MLVNRRQFLSIFSSVAFLRVSLTNAQSKYSETMVALKTAYKNEIQAHLNYLSYAEKAKQENYPGIGHLFISFATSESIYAHNFRKVLSTLGVQGWEPPKPEVVVFNTKKNLKNALEFEIKDIDERYPQTNSWGSSLALIHVWIVSISSISRGPYSPLIILNTTPFVLS